MPLEKVGVMPAGENNRNIIRIEMSVVGEGQLGKNIAMGVTFGLMPIYTFSPSNLEINNE